MHYSDAIMTTIASQITSLTIVYSIVYSDADQRKHQSSASLAFVRGIHRGPVNSLHKWPVTRKMFPFDDVIMVFFWLGIQYETIVWVIMRRRRASSERSCYSCSSLLRSFHQLIFVFWAHFVPCKWNASCYRLNVLWFCTYFTVL